MASFPQHFREHVLPLLKPKCCECGLMVRLKLSSFEEAFREVMRLAVERGALHLPESVLADLEDWICSELLRQIDAAEPRALEIKRMQPAWHRLSYDRAAVAAWRRKRAA